MSLDLWLFAKESLHLRAVLTIYDRDLYEEYRVLWAILRSVCVFAVIIVIIGSNRTVYEVEEATGL